MVLIMIINCWFPNLYLHLGPLNSKFVCPMAYSISPLKSNNDFKLSGVKTKFLISSSSSQICSLCRLLTVNGNSIIADAQVKNFILASIPFYLMSDIQSTSNFYWPPIKIKSEHPKHLSYHTQDWVTDTRLLIWCLAYCYRLSYDLPASNLALSTVFFPTYVKAYKTNHIIPLL